MTSGTLNSQWDLHGEVFRIHAHQLLFWAHFDVRHELTLELDEPGMTGKIAEAMKQRLDYHPDTPDAYLHYCVGDQEPVSPAGQTGNDRLRLDISLIRSGIRPRISYLFEAKRLRTSKFPIGKYVGAGGMGDFIECRYGRECPEAAMVALYEDRDLTYWKSELERVFQDDETPGRKKLRTTSKLSEISILPELEGELQSVHERTDLAGPICLFHIFLDCRP